MKMFPCLLAVLSSAGILAADKDRVLHSFQKIELTNQFWAEGAHFADFNRDGNQDIVSGPFWYEGPGFKNRHEYSPATQTFERTLKDGTKEQVPGYEGFLGSKNAYSGNFFAFTHDLNRDGWTDILIIGFPGEEVAPGTESILIDPAGSGIVSSPSFLNCPG